LSVVVRRVDPAVDLAAFLAIRNAVERDDPRAVEEERGWLDHHAGRRALFLASLDGASVGAGVASPPMHAPAGERRGFVAGWVIPAARRRGAGSALFAAASAHLLALGFPAATAWVSAGDPEGVAFLARRGWRETSRESRFRRDLTLPLPPRESPPGIAIELLDPDGDETPVLYAIDGLVSADIPGQPIDLGSYETWRSTELDRAARRRPLLIVARDAGTIVGFVNVHFPLLPDDRAWHSMTGVLPSHRGRGVGGALKVAALHELQSLGCVAAGTSNEERNVPMRRINERLGYGATPDEILFEGEL
jgi:GNAT superfamily N-acetyltransferase